MEERSIEDFELQEQWHVVESVQQAILRRCLVLSQEEQVAPQTVLKLRQCPSVKSTARGCFTRSTGDHAS